MDNTKAELIELIQKINIGEEIKQGLLRKIEDGDLSDVAKSLKNLYTDVDADVQSIDKIIALIDQAKGEVAGIEDEAKRHIETIASEAEDQLAQMDEEADNVEDLAESLSQDIEEEKKEQLRQQIGQ